jgi:hypothetical protein
VFFLPLGEQGRTPLYVGLLSTWGSVDGDLMFIPILEEGSFFGDSSRREHKCSKFSWAHITVPAHTKKSIFGALSWTQRVLRYKSGGIWNFGKGTGLSWADVKIMGHKGPVCKAWVHRDRKGSNPMYINQPVNQSIAFFFNDVC